MTLFLQRLFDGLTNGAIYAVGAIALVLIFKATTLVNFAQGSLAMFGAYFAHVFATEQGMPVLLAIFLAMIITAALGAVIERVLVRPFDPTDHLPVVLITFGLSFILEAVAGWKWGLEFKRFPTPFPGDPDAYMSIGGARIRYEKIGVIFVLLLMMAVTYVILNRTKIGLAFRAVSSNTESARLVGIRTGRTLQFGWAMACAFGTLGGSLVARFTNLEPSFMAKILIYSFAAATLGGLDSINGAVLGGVIVGLIASLGVPLVRENVPGFQWLTADLSLAVAFVVILGVLLVKPAGLFGSKKVERV